MADLDRLESDAGEHPWQNVLRYETPFELYLKIPQLPRLTQHRPLETENGLGYMMRLRASTTPEEAVTFTAFAALPKMAIWWGYECLRQSSCELSVADRKLMELVAIWVGHSDPENRYRCAQEALFSRVSSPAVQLGLAVAWSGGQVSPLDPAKVPHYRTPQAINIAVLSCLAKAGLMQRSVELARFINQATVLFRSV